MKRLIVAFAFMLMGGLAHAVTVSSTSAAMGGRPPLYLFPSESLSYSETGDFTGRIEIQRSFDGINFEPIGISTTNNEAGTFSGEVYNGDKAAYFRWYVSTVTAGSFTSQLSDRDDLYGEFTNTKGVPVIQLHDETTRFLNGKIQLGPTGVTSSTATDSGNSIGQYVTANLAGATNALEGHVLVATHPVAGKGFSVAVAAATADQTRWVGIAKGAASVGEPVEVYYSGFVLARTTGTVVSGDSLVTSSAAAGYLAADTTPTTGADVGVAIASGTTSGGLTRIRLR